MGYPGPQPTEVTVAQVPDQVGSFSDLYKKRVCLGTGPGYPHGKHLNHFRGHFSPTCQRQTHLLSALPRGRSTYRGSRGREEIRKTYLVFRASAGRRMLWVMCLDYRMGLATPRGDSRASSSGPEVTHSLGEPPSVTSTVSSPSGTP